MSLSTINYQYLTCKSENDKSHCEFLNYNPSTGTPYQPSICYIKYLSTTHGIWGYLLPPKNVDENPKISLSRRGQQNFQLSKESRHQHYFPLPWAIIIFQLFTLDYLNEVAGDRGHWCLSGIVSKKEAMSKDQPTTSLVPRSPPTPTGPSMSPAAYQTLSWVAFQKQVSVHFKQQISALSVHLELPWFPWLLTLPGSHFLRWRPLTQTYVCGICSLIQAISLPFPQHKNAS